MVDVNDVAMYLLSLFRDDAISREDGIDDGSDVSNLKLQKLLYYCQAYSLALTGEPMFAEEIEAWSYGPVVPSVYRRYKQYGRCDIPLADIVPFSIKDEKAAGIVRLVKRQKGAYSAIAIMDMAHRELPWKEAYDIHLNAPISNKTMRDYFADRLCREMSEEEEDRLWDSVTEPLDKDDIRELLAHAV